MDINEQVLAAFQAEHKEQIEGIRALLGELDQAALQPGDARLDEAFRLAHSLKGGARVCDLRPAEQLGHHLESLFAAVRQGELPWQSDVVQVVNQSLDFIEDWMAALAEEQALPDAAQSLAAIDGMLRGDAAKPSTAAADPSAHHESDAGESDGGQPIEPASLNRLPSASETVRVQTTSLDQLIHCSGQLLSELGGEDELAHELNALGSDLQSLRRERESIRQLASSTLHRLGNAPEFSRVVRYFDAVERQLESLTHRAQHLCRTQQRRQWRLCNRGQQIHQSAREARLVAVESVYQGFRKMVRDLGKDQGKPIEFTLRGLEHRADRLVLQALKDPLMHVLRNAVVHGIESPEERKAAGKPATGQIELTIEAIGNRLRICAADDGRGLDHQAIHDTAAEQGLLRKNAPFRGSDASDAGELENFLFQPGFTTMRDVSELAGRGMGLSVLHETVTRQQGEVRLHTTPGRGTRVELTIPLAVATHRLLLVRVAAQTYAIATTAIEQLLRVPRADVETLEGNSFISFQQKPIPLVALADLFGADSTHPESAGEPLCVAVLRCGNQLRAVAVDALLAQREAMIHDLTGPAAQAPYFSGAILLGSGEVALMLEPMALAGAPAQSCRLTTQAAPAAEETQPPTVLVVDDSFTTRTLEKSILEAQGYRVHIAVDGVDALALLRSQNVDLIISDVEMPRMNGFLLLENVKADNRLNHLPFILVTSCDKVADRENGLRLGADAYIVKQKFDRQDLLNTIRRIM